MWVLYEIIIIDPTLDASSIIDNGDGKLSRGGFILAQRRNRTIHNLIFLIRLFPAQFVLQHQSKEPPLNLWHLAIKLLPNSVSSSISPVEAKKFPHSMTTLYDTFYLNELSRPELPTPQKSPSAQPNTKTK